MNRCLCQSPPARTDGGSWKKWFSCSAFAAARDARRCSGFVHIATADNAIAARRAAPKPGAGNAGRPTAATSGVWKAGSIIGTGNVRIGDAGAGRA